MRSIFFLVAAVAVVSRIWLDMAGYGWMLLDIPPYLSPLSVEVSELSSRGPETVSDEAEVKFWLLVMLFRALKSVTGLRREGEAVGVL